MEFNPESIQQNRDNLQQLQSDLQATRDAVANLNREYNQLTGDNVRGVSNEFRNLSSTISRVASLNIKDLTTSKGRKQLASDIAKLKQNEQKSQNNINNLLSQYNAAQRSGNEAATKKLGDMLEAEYRRKDAIGETIRGAEQFAALAENSVLRFFDLTAQAKKLTDTLLGPGLFKLLLNADTNTTSIAKQLGISKDTARELRQEFNKLAINSNNVFVTSKALGGALLELGDNLEAVSGYTSDQLADQIVLTKQLGLSAEEASKIGALGIMNNKTTEEATEEILQQVKLLEAETGIRLDGRKILKEVASINGQLAAQYQFNNELLAEAVVKVKKFGLNLKEAEGIANNLLDFEQSISSELSAELLTGKNLNLERARLLALQGDTAAAAAEVASQFGSAEEFTSMNVLQQRELAKAVGLTANELADSIKKRDVLASLGVKNIEQLKEQGRLNELNTTEAGKQLLQQYKQEAAADKFAAAISKIQDVVGALLEGPLGGVVDAVATLASSSFAVYTALGLIGAIKFMGLINQIATLLPLLGASAAGAVTLSSALTFGVGAVAIVAAIAGVMAAYNGFKDITTADDMVYGNNMLVTKNKGAIALNNEDTIVAGTDLFRGGNNGGGGISDNQIEKLAGAINNKKVVFDAYSASGPQAFVNTERRRPSNLFF